MDKTVESDSQKIEKKTVDTYPKEEEHPSSSKPSLGVRPSAEPYMIKSLNQLIIDLNDIKKTLGSINVEILPDKGQALYSAYRQIKKCIRKKEKENKFFEDFNKLKISENKSLLKEPINETIPLDTEKTDKILKQPESRLTPSTFKRGVNQIQKPADLSDFDKIFDLIRQNEKFQFKIDLSNIRTQLMNHQVLAVQWMMKRESCSPFGGILADDMGLGKTLTILAFLCQNLRQNSLIIVPMSVLHQWKQEIEHHLKDFKYIIFHGSDRDKFITKMHSADVVITTFGTFASKSSCALRQHKWTRVIVDEAHLIKNHKTVTSNLICEISSKYHWALTGTPIQNSLTDLFSLIKFLKFEPFADKKTWDKYMEKHPLKKRFIEILINVILLRRTKNQLDADGNPLVKLPKRTEKIQRICLSKIERMHYDKINTKLRKSVYEFFNNKFNHAGLSSEQPKKTFGHVLVTLIRLQQACSHMSLIDQVLQPEEYKEGGCDPSLKEIEDLTKMFDDMIIAKDDPQNVFLPDFKSSKLFKMLEILEESKSANETVKFVIVSQWTSFLKLICSHLTKLNYTCETLSGSVTSSNRQSLVMRFNQNRDPQILLLSLKAGGVGLNLTGANNLILMDQHWNPALELQACDRIYRLGQTRDVVIHKLLVDDTIEDNIDRLKKHKLKMASDLYRCSQVSLRLTKEDMKSLFSIIRN